MMGIENLDVLGVLRILVVDMHPMFIVGTRKVLNGTINNVYKLNVVGDTNSIHLLEENIADLKPNIVVIDQNLISIEQYENLRKSFDKHNRPRILILLSSFSLHYIQQMIRVGVTGFLFKYCTSDELISGILDLVQDKLVVPDELIKEMFSDEAGRNSLKLTERETEILTLVAGGNSNKNIAEWLVISTRTVHFHMNNIMNKLNVTSRFKAVVVARENGLIS
jgi:two-component system nitrate/nitrite response regulator NarL